ncbi:protein tyrosine phosphatase receptor type C-associated protein [Cinclus cinclus]|uniref:protein tyrosine phosphatase receptor type C-associated protein n=1 Tax=Cinclus cinclus TaxID=127875 RepID=UPI002E0DFF01
MTAGSWGGLPHLRARPLHRDLLWLHPVMAGPRWHPVLLALAGPAAAGEPAAVYNDRVVAVLLGVLLCLALLLALAWNKLCRLSAGRYHPRPLGRRALEMLRGQWHRLRSPEDPTAAFGDGDSDGDVVAVRDEEEELMPWSLERRRPEDEQEEDEQEEDEQEEDEEEAEVAAEGEERPLSEGEVAGGSAEALLSDLHAFSGTAAWGDTRPHVTAL